MTQDETNTANLITVAVGPVAGDRLRQHVDRLLRVRADIADLQTDAKEMLKAATQDGFDGKTIQALVRRLTGNPAEIAAQEELLHLYEDAYQAAAVPAVEQEGAA